MDISKGKAFDVESALLMYADDFAFLPAKGIYDKGALEQLNFAINKCHIYMIGFLPVIELVDATQDNANLVLKFRVGGTEETVSLEMPQGAQLEKSHDDWFILDSDGNKSWPPNELIQTALKRQSGKMVFKVKYVGQAFGKDGSRNAIDRLKKHETLQKIAIHGTPKDQSLYVFMLGIQAGNRQAIMFNPHANDSSSGEARIEASLDKLFDTSEAERVTLFEASLIRFFQPEFNKEFKNSFPSSNLKALQDCYDKDFSAVCAEINFDHLPFSFESEVVKDTDTVMAYFDLHEDENRKIFFSPKL